MLKAVLLDVYNEKVEIKDIEPELEEYYRLLDCTLVDIVTRKIGGKLFYIVCDEEGLYSHGDDPRISALNGDYEPMLVGNLLVLGYSDDGEERGLEDEEVVHVMDHIRKIRTNHRPDGYKMLTDVDY